ncbi:hypothetical protein [Neobacillus notoginsengisoli]|nr:hypothetical protein [Neobacillus notoginsengisoli]
MTTSTGFEPVLSLIQALRDNQDGFSPKCRGVPCEHPNLISSYGPDIHEY